VHTEWGKARRAANHLLKSAFRVDLRKSLNPLDQDDFLLIIAQLSDQLRAITGPLEKQAVRTALRMLDVDFATLTSAELGRIVHATNLSMMGIPARVMPEIQATLRADTTETVAQTKIRLAGTYNLAISTTFDAVDQNIVDALSRVGGWVTDEYGRRAASFTTGVERIVARGMAEGLRNEEIAKDLRAHGRSVAIDQPREYWRLVATNASNRARGWGNVRGMDEAGIANMVYSAVMDERTTDICQALDGTVFPVSRGLAAYADLETAAQADPQAAEVLWPFVKERSLGGGVKEMFVEPRGGARTVLGQRTPTGFQGMLSPDQLAAAGVIVPPVHHHCRSTLIPDI